MAAAEAFCHPSTNESLSMSFWNPGWLGTPVLVHAGGAVMPYHCRKSNGGLWFRKLSGVRRSADDVLAPTRT